MAALALSYNSDLTPDKIANLLKNASIDVESPGFDYISGSGVVDALYLLGLLTNLTGECHCQNFGVCIKKDVCHCIETHYGYWTGPTCAIRNFFEI